MPNKQPASSKFRPTMLLSFFSRYCVEFLTFISVMVISRVLTPEEIGIFSIAFVSTLILQELQNFGVAQYVIQEPRLTREKMRTAIGVTSLVAWSIAVVMFFGASSAASFYGQAGLEQIFPVLAISFVLTPFRVVTSAYFRRHLAFGKMAIAIVTACLLRVAATIGLALTGFSYMSMAWGNVIGAASSVVLFCVLKPDIVPLVPSFKNMRRAFTFGSFASAAGILKQVGEALPDLVIGKLMNMESVAYFSRAYGLPRIFDRGVTQGLRPVLLPHFSAVHREDAIVTDAYLKTISHMTCLAWPFYAFLFVMSFPVVRLLYGGQWDASVPIAQILCVWASLHTLYTFSSELLISIGSVKSVFGTQCIAVPVKFGLVWAACAGDLTTVGFAFVVAALAEFFIVSHFIRKYFGITIRQLLGSTGKSLIIAVATLVPPAAISVLMDIRTDHLIVPLLLAVLGAGGAWLLAAAMCKHEILREIQLLWRSGANKLSGSV